MDAIAERRPTDADIAAFWSQIHDAGTHGAEVLESRPGLLRVRTRSGDGERRILLDVELAYVQVVAEFGTGPGGRAKRIPQSLLDQVYEWVADDEESCDLTFHNGTFRAIRS